MHQCLRIIFLFFLINLFGYTFAADLKVIEREISDSVITTKVTAKFTKNIHLNPFKIYVSTDNGIVRLSGNVKDKDAFIEALRIAKNTKGVKAVDAENLNIKIVNTALTDAYITAKVETAILKAKVLDDESIPIVGINAKTVNGIVTLSGEVKNVNSIIKIIKRVNNIKGVKKIITELQIKDSV